MDLTYVYETIALAVFIAISLAFIKPPQWLLRRLDALVKKTDRWL